MITFLKYGTKNNSIITNNNYYRGLNENIKYLKLKIQNQCWKL